MMKKIYRSSSLLALLVVLTSVFANRADAIDLFVSSGRFSIGFSDRSAPPPPVVVPVAPPVVVAPAPDLYYRSDDVFLEASGPDLIVAPPPRAVVYGPEYRTAPYLAAVPEPLVVVRPRPVPPPVVDTYPPRPYPPRAYPYPPRPYGPGPRPRYAPAPPPHGPNFDGGMTPLGPGPAPAFGPRGPRL